MLLAAGLELLYSHACSQAGTNGANGNPGTPGATGASGDVVGKKKNMVSKFSGLKKTIDFKRYDGRMYLNYITLISKVNWYDPNTKELKFETELFQQLLVNEVQPNTPDRIGSTESMRNYGLQYQNFTYNKKFWDSYNVIKETPLDKQILSDLEKHSPLEKQFEDNWILASLSQPAVLS